MKHPLLVVSFVFLLNLVGLAQFHNFNFSTNPPEVFENNAFTLSVELLQGESIKQAVLFYRLFGTSEFLPIEMIIKGNTLTGHFEAKNVIPPSIEFYIKTINVSGIENIYPTLALETKNFIKIDVRTKVEQSSRIIMLNPTQDEVLTKDEFFFALSIFRLSERIDITKTKVLINDSDFSSLLQITDDLIFIPQNSFIELNLGANFFKILLFDDDGKLVNQYSSSFQIVTKEQKEEFEKLKLAFNGSIELNLANENLRSGNANYSKANVILNGNYGSIFSTANFYVTNEEKSNIQPQNRFGFQIYNDWFNLKLGDHFPVYPSLILSGKRVRGISSSLMFGFFNIQTTYGEITRKIEGDLLSVIKRDTVVLDPNLIPIDSSKYGQPFGLIRFGTYSRKLFALRPSFGSGENFQLGFTYLHSRDDEKSVEFSAKPKENLVLGTDIFFGFDQKRIQFNFQTAFSLMNKDIAPGNISDTTLDSLAKNDKLGIDPDILRKLRDIMGSFITVNQHLSPLNPQELPTLAAEGNFSINYFGNYLKGTYLYRGNDYTSFGQNYLRTDVQGFQFLDRISLFENRVFLSVSFERLNDNLQNTKIATTTFNNYEGSVSLYLRKDFPVVNFSYSNYDTKNDIEPNDTDSIKIVNIVNDNIKVMSLSSSYDLDFYIKHRLTISYLNSTKKDFTYKDFSSNFNTFNFSVQNLWSSELISFFSTNFSNSKIKNRDFDYFSITFGARLNLLENKLNNSASLSIFTGDLKRNVLDLSSRYRFLNNLSAGLSLRFILNDSNIKNESIINFLLRYEI